MLPRFLAIDYGTKRLGLAVNDLLGLTAQPLPYLANDSAKLKALRKIIQEKEIKKIILGLPVALSGQEEIAARKARDFAEELRVLNLPLEFYDERLTTAAAHKMMVQCRLPGRNRREKVDSLAACILLEDYLRSQGA
ncbi:Holliday junction resolvase [Candidatus Termititenax persephonae]|uniref:Putative pre-16S rRNA nuclease n=1 Tax=Candidatus Termititenax persephonae TaxID=2218525 RepID=A0A388TIP4_9BACT|nr:Holliday junction resolvase [Candidatus Termititenax persephonae]